MQEGIPEYLKIGMFFCPLSESCFIRWLISVHLYEYEILAFDRQVTGSSPTVGLWSPWLGPHVGACTQAQFCDSRVSV